MHRIELVPNVPGKPRKRTICSFCDDPYQYLMRNTFYPGQCRMADFRARADLLSDNLPLQRVSTTELSFDCLSHVLPKEAFKLLVECLATSLI